MKIKSKKLNDLAKLLPQGVSEDTVNKIVELVASVIEEEVKYKSEKLQAKVTGFMRLQLDEFKEQARNELELENSNIHDLKVFEDIKSLIAATLTQKDEDNVVAKKIKESTEIESENELLVSQLSEALEHISNLEEELNETRKFAKKAKNSAAQLKEENEGLKLKIKPSNPSDKGKVITANLNEHKTENKDSKDNPLITKDMLRLSGLVN